MTKENIIQEALSVIDEISIYSIYMSGILLNDSETQCQVKILTHLQSIIMQSLQINNQKRAVKYIAAYYKLMRENAVNNEQLKSIITEHLLVSKL